MSRIYTEHFSGLIPETESSALYEFLRDSVHWEEGIKSKKGFTRLAKSIDLCGQKPVDLLDSEDIISETVRELITKYVKTVVSGKNKKAFNDTIPIYGVYLNYYQTGNMWTPNHTHPGTVQVVFSLGTTRTLVMNKKSIEMKNGDAIIFGSGVHGVPKELTSEGRISIAFFIAKNA